MRDSFYLNFLGGGRARNIELLSVTPPQGTGTAEIVGDLFRFAAGPTLAQNPFGLPLPVPITVEYLDGAGNTVVSVVLVTAVNTPQGVELTLPGGRTVTDSALLSPIPVAEQFPDPLSVTTDPIPPVALDESIFVDIFNRQNPEFLDALLATQETLLKATVDKALADEQLDEAAAALTLLTDARDARDIATVQRSIADTQATVLADLSAQLNAAVQGLLDATVAFAQAQQAVEAAGAQVQVIGAQAQLFEEVIIPQAAQAFVEADVALLVQLSIFGLAPPAEQHFDDPVFGPIIEAVAQARQSALEGLEEAEAQLASLQEDLAAAINGQVAASAALAPAAAAVQDAEAAVAEFEGVDFASLEEAVAQLQDQATLSELLADQLELVAADVLGVDAPISDATLDQFTQAFGQALTAQAEAVGAVAGAQAAFEAAAEAYQAQIDALPDEEFDLAVFDFGFGAAANLGLEFHFNRATEETGREFVTTLVYDVAVDLELFAIFTVPDVFLGIDVDTPIEIDTTIARSGRVELGGQARAERFDPLAPEDRGARFADWADSFDFV